MHIRHVIDLHTYQIHECWNVVAMCTSSGLMAGKSRVDVMGRRHGDCCSKMCLFEVL